MILIEPADVHLPAVGEDSSTSLVLRLMCDHRPLWLIPFQTSWWAESGSPRPAKEVPMHPEFGGGTSVVLLMSLHLTFTPFKNSRKCHWSFNPSISAGLGSSVLIRLTATSAGEG